MRHADRAVLTRVLRDGPGGAERGAHLARRALLGIDDHMAPQARVHEHILRLPQRIERGQQTFAAVGNEVRQRAVLAHLHEPWLPTLLHTPCVLDGVVSRHRRNVLSLVLHAGEEAPTARVVALVARPAHG